MKNGEDDKTKNNNRVADRKQKGKKQIDRNVYNRSFTTTNIISFPLKLES